VYAQKHMGITITTPSTNIFFHMYSLHLMRIQMIHSFMHHVFTFRVGSTLRSNNLVLSDARGGGPND
jgi:hypothetical protein